MDVSIERIIPKGILYGQTQLNCYYLSKYLLSYLLLQTRQCTQLHYVHAVRASKSSICFNALFVTHTHTHTNRDSVRTCRMFWVFFPILSLSICIAFQLLPFIWSITYSHTHCRTSTHEPNQKCLLRFPLIWLLTLVVFLFLLLFTCFTFRSFVRFFFFLSWESRFVVIGRAFASYEYYYTSSSICVQSSDAHWTG